uniref:DUF5666 domain-containing protein n=1 Tax=Schlesneria paludicola TaxID=360056 RepID=A0A7C2K0V4_9PLAN
MHRLLSLLVGGLILFAAESRAEDPAIAGTRWVGSAKVADPEGKGKKKKVRLTTTEYVLIILSRDGEKFTGEVHRDKGRRVVQVEGKIDNKGITDFRVTRRLKGAEADDIVDNARHHGRFKDDEYTGKFLIPGNDARSGEIHLKLQKPDDAKAATPK